MFQLYLKKEQYQKVSSKFKDHIHNRQDKVNYVTSKDTKIQEKMKAFNRLINDDLKGQNKSNGILCKQGKVAKNNQSQKKYIKQLLKMTEEFDQWKNTKISKSLHKENIFNQTNYQQKKQARRNNQIHNFNQTVNQGSNLKQSRKPYRKQRFPTEMKTRIQSNLFQKSSPNQSLTNSFIKQDCLQSQSKNKDDKKQRWRNYFCEMRQSNGHKKHLSQVLNIERKDFTKNNNIIQKCSLSKTFCGMSNLYKSSYKDRVLISENPNEDMFKDDSIHDKMAQTFSCFNAKNQKNEILENKHLQKMPTYLLNSFHKRGFHTRNTTGLMNSSQIISDHSPQKIKIHAVKNLKCL